MTKDALSKLAKLCDASAKSLKLLGQQPLAIASASSKFNDAHEDDYWCAVQLGPYRWEQSQFFGSKNAPGSAREFSNLLLEPSDYGSANSLSSDITAARELLRELDESGWHELSEEASGLPSTGAILALVIQFDQVWLHCSHPIGQPDAEQIFALVDGRLEAFCLTNDRFDELVGSAELIRCKNPNLEVLAKLAPSARDQFSPEIADPVAARKLGQSLVDIALQIDDLVHVVEPSPPPFVFRLGVSYRDVRYGWDKSRRTTFLGSPRFALGSVYFEKGYFRGLNTNRARIDDAEDRIRQIEAWPFLELSEQLEEIDQFGIRRQFEDATGMDTFDTDDLFLVVVAAVPYLSFRSRLYQCEKSGIVNLGRWTDLVNPLGPDSSDWLQNIHRIFATPNRR